MDGVDASYLGLTANQLAKIASDLKYENARLRLFIDARETCWKYVGWCDKCPYNGADDENDDCWCTLKEMLKSYARELKIEVNA